MSELQPATEPAKRSAKPYLNESAEYRQAPEALLVAETELRRHSERVANHFFSTCGCDIYADSPAFETDGSWDGKTRKIALNARLFDDFEAAGWCR